MRMKKLMALLTAGALALSCAPAVYAQSGGEGGTLSILSWRNEETMKPVLDAFVEENPGVTIDFMYAPPIQDYYEKLHTLLYSDSAPDVFIYIDGKYPYDMVNGGYVMDLTDEPYMQDGTIPDNAKEFCSVDGRVYGLTTECWVGGIYVNDRMLEEAGVERDPQSWDEFMEVLKKLKDAGFNPITDGHQDSIASFPQTLFAAEVYSKDPDFAQKIFNGETTFAELVKTPLEMWYQMVEEGYLTADMVGATGDQILSDFATEQTAMIVSGPWCESTIASINPDLKYHAMAIPGKEEGNLWCPGCYDIAYSINSKAKDPETAKAFLRFLASEKGTKISQEMNATSIITKGYENPVTPVNAVPNKAIEEGHYFHLWAMGIGRYEEPLQTAFDAAVREVQVGALSLDEPGKAVDAKLAEMSAN